MFGKEDFMPFWNPKGGASVPKQKQWGSFGPKKKQELRKKHKDTDGDGVPDMWDCQPFNFMRQDVFSPDQLEEIFNTDFSPKKKLGSGSFGSVFTTQSEDYVVKLNNLDTPDKTQPMEFMANWLQKTEGEKPSVERVRDVYHWFNAKDEMQQDAILYIKPDTLQSGKPESPFWEGSPESLNNLLKSMPKTDFMESTENYHTIGMEMMKFDDMELGSMSLMSPSEQIEVDAGSYTATGIVRPKMTVIVEHNNPQNLELITEDVMQQIYHGVKELSDAGLVIWDGLQIGLDKNGKAYIFDTDTVTMGTPQEAKVNNKHVWEAFVNNVNTLKGSRYVYKPIKVDKTFTGWVAIKAASSSADTKDSDYTYVLYKNGKKTPTAIKLSMFRSSAGKFTFYVVLQNGYKVLKEKTFEAREKAQEYVNTLQREYSQAISSIPIATTSSRRGPRNLPEGWEALGGGVNQVEWALFKDDKPIAKVGIQAKEGLNKGFFKMLYPESGGKLKSRKVDNQIFLSSGKNDAMNYIEGIMQQMGAGDVAAKNKPGVEGWQEVPQMTGSGDYLFEYYINGKRQAWVKVKHDPKSRKYYGVLRAYSLPNNKMIRVMVLKDTLQRDIEDAMNTIENAFKREMSGWLVMANSSHNYYSKYEIPNSPTGQTFYVVVNPIKRKMLPPGAQVPSTAGFKLTLSSYERGGAGVIEHAEKDYDDIGTAKKAALELERIIKANEGENMVRVIKQMARL
jgi:hypothetical protein